MTRYIIEHPTRGVLKDLELTDSEEQRGRFGWALSRIEGMSFYSLNEAQRAKSRIEPERLRAACQIRREPTDKDLRSSSMQDLWKVVG